MGAMARIIGLFKDGTEKLGEGEREWAKVAHRFEQAWAAQTKELWQFGMPLRPNIVDFLRPKSDTIRGAATKLPDRRESARLAERLASGTSGSFFSDIDSAVRQLSQYGQDPPTDPLKQGGARNGQGSAGFTGLEALKQMRRQKE